jgi:hypothetical protein
MRHGAGAIPLPPCLKLVQTLIQAGLGVGVALQFFHVDLGEEDYLFKGTTFTGAPFNTGSFRSDLEFDTFTLRLNVKLN